MFVSMYDECDVRAVQAVLAAGKRVVRITGS